MMSEAFTFLYLQAPPFTIKNLVAGTEYEFQVSAKNVMGFSESSEMSKSVVTTETGNASNNLSLSSKLLIVSWKLNQ